MSSNSDVDQCLDEIEDMINNENFMILDEINEGEDSDPDVQFSECEYNGPISPKSETSESYHTYQNEETDKQIEAGETSEDDADDFKHNEETENGKYDKVNPADDKEQNENGRQSTTENPISNDTDDDESEDLNSTLNTASDEIANQQEEGQPTDDNVRAFLHLVETFEYTKEQMTVTDIGAAKNLDQTPVYLIHKKRQLKKVISVLKQKEEISLDILMSTKGYEPEILVLLISAREVDYIINAITLRNSLSLLTEILLSPKIVKIVYRGKAVLPHLQQILHLFVVNLFEVERAASVALGSPPTSLNALTTKMYSLKKTKFKMEFGPPPKPITEEMRQFARADAHYLIHLYHHFKNILLKDHVEEYHKLLHNCREFCKIVYPSRKTVLLNTLQRELKFIQDSQIELLGKLHEWKHSLAQTLNVCHEKIIGKSKLLILALQMPTTEEEVLAITGTIFVKENVKNIIKIIEEVKCKHNKIFNRAPRPRTRSHHKNKPAVKSVTKAQKRTRDEKPDTTPSKQPKIEQASNNQQSGYWVQEIFLKNTAKLLENLSNNTNKMPTANAVTATINSVVGADVSSRPDPFIQSFNLTSFTPNSNNLPVQNMNPQFNVFNQNPPRLGDGSFATTVPNSLAVQSNSMNHQFNGFAQNSIPPTPVGNFTTPPPNVNRFPIQNDNINPRFDGITQNVAPQRLNNTNFSQPQKTFNSTNKPKRTRFQDTLPQTQNNGPQRNQAFVNNSQNFAISEDWSRPFFTPRNERPKVRDTWSSEAQFSGESSHCNNYSRENEPKRHTFLSKPQGSDMGSNRSSSDCFSANKGEIDQFKEYAHVLTSMNQKINELQKELAKFNSRRTSPERDIYSRRAY